MKEQYLAQIQNGYCKENEWWNAKMMMLTDEDMKNGNTGRYCKTLEEAKQWIDKAVRKGQRLATHKNVIGTPPLSIESAPNEKNLVINTRIKKRLVTEWEDVE